MSNFVINFWYGIQFLDILVCKFKFSLFLDKKSLLENCLIFFSNSKLKFPSLEKKYPDNKDLIQVFPLLGYDANQIIIIN